MGAWLLIATRRLKRTKNHKYTGRSNVVTIIPLLRMITEAVCFLYKYFRILGVVSGNEDEGYGPPPNIQVSAFQSSVIPTQKAHPFNIQEKNIIHH